MSDVTDRDPGAVAEDVVDSVPLRAVGRLGLTAYGLVHLLIAALITQVALGGSERTDKKGALEAIASTGPGVVLLWIIAVGLVALVVWQLAEAVWGHRRVPTRQRVRRTVVNLAEAVLFGVLAFSAGSVAAKGGAPSAQKSFATVVFELPGGRYLVALAGVGLVAGGVYAAYRGITHSFLRELDLRGAGLNRSLLVTRIGQLGWTALGVVYVVPGVLLVVAAVRFDPSTPTGLDAGLQAVVAQPYGPALLLVLALGLVAFGVYSLFDARYRKA